MSFSSRVSTRAESVSERWEGRGGGSFIIRLQNIKLLHELFFIIQMLPCSSFCNWKYLAVFTIVYVYNRGRLFSSPTRSLSGSGSRKQEVGQWRVEDGQMWIICTPSRDNIINSGLKMYLYNFINILLLSTYSWTGWGTAPGRGRKKTSIQRVAQDQPSPVRC